LFCNNKNLKRKQLLNLLESYQVFCESISKKDANHTLLLLHTNPVGRNTSNLYDASDYINTLGNVKFSNSVVGESTLTQMYNVADATINTASNEGFGLSTLESLSCETPIIVNKTGGLNEQIDDNNTWGIGISPSSRILNGSPRVPFLYEDILDKNSVSMAIKNIYEMSTELRSQMGKLAREFVIRNQYTSSDMTMKFGDYIKRTVSNFKPRAEYTLTKI
jgi:glycosyltransferase involved in cell wall biosynthesis